LVQPTARTITCLVHCTCHCSTLLYLCFEMIEPLCFGKLSRRDADDSFEYSLEMMRTQSDFRAQFFERRRLSILLVDVDASAPHGLDLRIIHFRIPRPATFAGSKACVFSCLRNAKEDHLFATRAPRRTRRPAVDASGSHRKENPSVKPPIPSEHGLPCNV